MWRNLVSLFSIAVFVVLSGVASAQMTPQDRQMYDDWLLLANRAERIVDTARAPDSMLESVREDIVAYREKFIEARNQNKDRIATLNSQLAALGPAPEGSEEPADIAKLRADLNAQLDELRVPGVVGEEAYNRANGLIGEIDRLLHERRANQIISRSASPLNATVWPEAFAEIRKTGSLVVRETEEIWESEDGSTKLHQNLLWVAALILIGLVLIVLGRRWAIRLHLFLSRNGGTGRGVWAFVASLARIVVPFVGLMSICAGISLTGLLGERGTALVSEIPGWGLTFLYFKWLADQLYGVTSGPDLSTVAPGRRTEAKVLVMGMAVMLILHGALELYEEGQDVSAAVHSVLVFPLIVISAAILLRLQRLVLRPSAVLSSGVDEDGARAEVSGLVNFLRRALVLLGISMPIVAALGYVNAAEAFVFPAISTLSLISLILVLQRFFGAVYAWASGKGDAAYDSLFTVLIGFLLALLSLPALALIWGVRPSDLTELWTRFMEGFYIGETRISPMDFVTVLVIFAIGYGLTRAVQGGLRVNLLPKTRLDPGAQNAIVSGTGYIGIFLAALVAITGAGLDLSSLALVASALTVGIGFGLQTIVSNFVSGIILLIERPISKGDWIEVGGHMGYVRDISVRSTRIETFDRTDVIVPNSDLISGAVTNYTHGKTVGRVIVPVGVAYGTDTRQVETILSEIANAHPMVLANPPPSVVFQGFGADALDFEIRAILRDVNWVLSVKSDMNHEIASRFVAAGIEIPFAQRDIWLRNPEMLGNSPVSGSSAQSSSDDGDIDPDDASLPAAT